MFRSAVQSALAYCAGWDMILSFEGTVPSGVITDLESRFVPALESRGFKTSLIRTVVRVATEAIQNLYHHSEQVPPSFLDSSGKAFPRYAIYAMGTRRDCVKLLTGNFVDNTTRHFLESRLDCINQMDNDTVRKHHRAGLVDGKISKKSGAGLGLLYIRRLLSAPVEYRFERVDEDYSFYTLIMTIDPVNLDKKRDK